MKRKFLALLLVISMAMALAGTASADISRTKTYASGQYSDVAPDAWYADSVKNAFELGLMSGSSATTFNPAGTFTLAEAATIAARMHDLYTGGSGVLGASTPWYQSAVDYCVNQGIFGIDDFDDFTCYATRAEMASMIAAALPEEAWAPINNIGKLPDVSWETPYHEAITQLYNAGVFSGSDEYGMFHPYAFITRAEVAAIVARCADPSLRLTLNLTPASQRPAVVLPGEPGEMSHDRLIFTIPNNSNKYGYVDVNGNIIFPAQYNSAKPFNAHGLAKISYYTSGDLYGRYNFIDMSGTPQFNEWFSGIAELKNQQYLVGRSTGKRGSNAAFGVIDSHENVIVPLNKGYARSQIFQVGNCFVARTDEYSDTYDVYNSVGQLIFSCNERQLKFDKYDDNSLMAVKQGEKWAVMYNGNYVTEAVYTDVDLLDGGAWAIAYYGTQKSLVSRYGVVPGTEFSLYVSLSRPPRVTSDNNIYFKNSNYLGDLPDTHFTPFGQVNDPPVEEEPYDDDAEYRVYYDGDTPFYSRVEKPKSEYWLGKENGMPVLYYGSKDDLDKPQEVVIGKFQGSFYYDQIRSLGEGYYGCRFNETWYLVHS